MEPCRDKVIKAWESFTGWLWMATEQLDEHHWYGLVRGMELEWGPWDARELEPLIKKGKVWEVKPQDLLVVQQQFDDWSKKLEGAKAFIEG